MSEPSLSPNINDDITPKNSELNKYFINKGQHSDILCSFYNTPWLNKYNKPSDDSNKKTCYEMCKGFYPLPTKVIYEDTLGEVSQQVTAPGDNNLVKCQSLASYFGSIGAISPDGTVMEKDLTTYCRLCSNHHFRSRISLAEDDLATCVTQLKNFVERCNPISQIPFTPTDTSKCQNCLDWCLENFSQAQALTLEYYCLTCDTQYVL